MPYTIVPVFSKNEVKTIRLICKQYDNREIADKLGISHRTVEDYRANIIRKTKSRNTVGIVLFAIKHGLHKIKGLS